MRRTPAQGFALTTVLLLLIVLMALVTAYFFLTNVELSTTGASAASTTGFYAAEAGLNLRGEEIRTTFQDFNRPSGTAYTNPKTACPNPGSYTSAPGSDNFACRDVTLNGRTVTTAVVQDPKNLSLSDADRMITIQGNDQFAGLNAIEYIYDVVSKAYVPNDTRPEAQLNMVFRSRLVPLFQFAAFYNKDLEISPGANMTLNGRVHVNGDLYLNTGATLDISGVTTVAKHSSGVGGGGLWRQRKDDNTCGGTVRVNDASTSTSPEPSVNCSGNIPQTTLDGWNRQILTGLNTINTPEVESFDIGQENWGYADLRIALDLRSGPPKIIVPNKNVIADNPTANALMTSTLNSCTSNAATTRPYTSDITDTTGTSGNQAVEASTSFRDTREGKGRSGATGTPPSVPITMLEVDVRGLLSCMHQQRSILFGESPNTTLGRGIDDTTQGGLVVYLTVLGPNSGAASNLYGVRVRNGQQLSADASGAPQIMGLTFVSDQALYAQGDYNLDTGSNVWRPASFLVDSLNILSEAWDAAGSDSRSGTPIGVAAASLPTTYSPTQTQNNRYATNTTINAALLAGTTSTGNREGTSGQGVGYANYNGGLENYPRLHEDWNGGALTRTTTAPGATLTYRGSLVSLGVPRHSNSGWPGTGVVYDAPTRVWSYDTRFNNAVNLPPLAPRFVYLRQERFARDFER